MLLISDGLCNEGDPEQSARRCASAGVPITSILIDPTPEGEEIARRISIGGKVSGVESEAQFSDAMSEASATHERTAAQPTPVPTALLSIVGAVAAVVTAGVAVTSVFTQLVENTHTALPLTTAALCLLVCCMMIWIYVATESSNRPIYLSDRDDDVHFGKHHRFELKTRRFALVTAIGSFLGMLLMIYLAWSNHNGRPDDRDSTTSSLPNRAGDLRISSTKATQGFDVFISHSSNDKDDVVRPLARELQAAGLRVLYEEFDLKIGGNLGEKIDDGLSRSRLGIIVLSENFFAQGWTTYELDDLVTRNIEGKQTLLPISHKISQERIAQFAPSLDHRLTRSTSQQTIKAIAEEIIGIASSDGIRRKDP